MSGRGRVMESLPDQVVVHHQVETSLLGFRPGRQSRFSRNCWGLSGERFGILLDRCLRSGAVLFCDGAEIAIGRGWWRRLRPPWPRRKNGPVTTYKHVVLDGAMCLAALAFRFNLMSMGETRGPCAQANPRSAGVSAADTPRSYACSSSFQSFGNACWSRLSLDSVSEGRQSASSRRRVVGALSGSWECSAP